MSHTVKVNEYELQATNFMQATKTGISTSFHDHAKYFDTDKEERDIYKVTLTTPAGRYAFKFGQSITNSDQNTPPTAYDIFTCVTKYDPGTFDNFCSEFGYDTDSRSAEKTYKAVCREWKNISRLYTPEQLELMQEIQ